MSIKYWGLSMLAIAFTLETEAIAQYNPQQLDGTRVGNLHLPLVQFDRELILGDTVAYKDNNTVFVRGKIHNSSRSPIYNNMYAIAYFF